MDGRLILVVAPILLAASWAVFHIGRATEVTVFDMVN
jgi:hypothetical protein